MMRRHTFRPAVGEIGPKKMAENNQTAGKWNFEGKTHTFPDIGDQRIAWHGDIFIFAFIDSVEKAE